MFTLADPDLKGEGAKFMNKFLQEVKFLKNF